MTGSSSGRKVGKVGGSGLSGTARWHSPWGLGVGPGNLLLRAAEAPLIHAVHLFSHQPSPFHCYRWGNFHTQQIAPRRLWQVCPWKPLASSRLLQQRVMLSFPPSRLLTHLEEFLQLDVPWGGLFPFPVVWGGCTRSWAGFKGALSLALFKAIGRMRFCLSPWPSLGTSARKKNPGPVHVGAGPGISWHGPS